MDDSVVGISVLKRMPLFAGVAQHDLENIMKLGRLRSFGPGETIVERGEPGDALYIVLRGTARVEVGGRRHDLGPGDFFGEMALIAGGKRVAAVKAEDRVDTLRIGADEFQGFLLQQPRVGVAMLRSMVERLHEVQERIETWSA
ncbi:MAG: cyclic nucleotide-binding domain-containing protein [Actinobacteria bacterium]|nr:cyclic nucleotide-binding domain-containing protein [Actinomycetota bacterium]